MTNLICMTHIGDATFGGPIQTVNQYIARILLHFFDDVPVYAHLMSGQMKGEDVQLMPHFPIDRIHKHVQFYYIPSTYNLDAILQPLTERYQ